MNGETTKFYQYEKTSGRINVPVSISKVLNWKHKNSIGMIIKTIDGQTGLFIWKREEEV